MTLTQAFDDLFVRFRCHFKRPETFERARAFAFSYLLSYGRRTISRLICTRNVHHRDWSADYKFFSRAVWNPDDLFYELFQAALPYSEWPAGHIVCTMDASLGKKTGRTIPGVSTLRDPMSLPFHTNLVRGLRYIEVSILVGPAEQLQYHRAIPIWFKHSPPAKKPKKNASDEDKARYRQAQKAQNLNTQGRQAVFELQEYLHRQKGGKKLTLVLTVDGSFCNRRFLKDLPSDVVIVARARKDMKLFAPLTPSGGHGKGRRRLYGERLPTPEAMRRDDQTYPWKTMRVYAAGKYHDLRYKCVGPVLWQKGTRSQRMRLLIIAPLRYRKSKQSKLLYRRPAYLLAAEGDIPDENLIQYYFLHWDIEVNHRDEKSLLGLYEAQVRSEKSVERCPQFSALVYGVLLLAALRAYGPERTDHYLPLPKWRKPTQRRPSTLDILAQFRREILIAQLKEDPIPNQPLNPKRKRQQKRPRSNIEAKKRGFVKKTKQQRSTLKLPVNILSALLYAYG